MDRMEIRRPLSAMAGRLVAALLVLILAAGAGQAQEDDLLDRPPGGEKLDHTSPEIQKRAYAAALKTIAERKPEFWHEVWPALLKGVTPERLKAEGGALVILRAYAKLPEGQDIPFPYFYALREVNTGRLRVVLLRKSGSFDQRGWGVAVVPPGRYASAGSPAKLNIILVHDGTLAHRVRLPYGGARVAPEQAVRVEAGEVIYLGTEVHAFSERKPPPKSILVLDHSAAAQAYAREELPAFAPYLKTRLMPSIEPVVLE